METVNEYRHYSIIQDMFCQFHPLTSFSLPFSLPTQQEEKKDDYHKGHQFRLQISAEAANRLCF